MEDMFWIIAATIAITSIVWGFAVYFFIKQYRADLTFVRDNLDLTTPDGLAMVNYINSRLDKINGFKPAKKGD